MSDDTVYIIGAGFNQYIKDKGGLNPPLSKNFFSTMLKSEKYNNGVYSNQFNHVFEYIHRYWKMSKEDLLNEYFNIEECFTFLQLQILDSIGEKDYKELHNMLRINSSLKIMFIDCLSQFQKFTKDSEWVIRFAECICKENPNIITFNYDCNLEKSIEYVSSKIGSKENKCGCMDKINYHLDYGVRFDEIHKCKEGKCQCIKGEQFYNEAKNNLHNFKLLKLHGSLNWFEYIPIISKSIKDEQTKEKKVVLTSDDWWNIKTYDSEEYIIDPLIIPPVLYKNYKQRIILDIWKEAKRYLCKCKNLVVIGYSFPSTDFGMRKLLIEAFEKNDLETLTIVNPNTDIVKDIKSLIHYKKPVLVCSSLQEFIENK